MTGPAQDHIEPERAAIEKILVEASPGEVRAIACTASEPWDFAIERPLLGPQPNDVYWARAGASGPGGGRFFDLGGGSIGLARRPRAGWTDGAYGLVQVIRGEAADKGPRVTDRVWLADCGVEASLGSTASPDDRIEISRRIPHARREMLREMLSRAIEDGAAVRIAHDPGEAGVESATVTAVALVERLKGLAALGGAARRVRAAEGEVGWLADRWPHAAWAPADLATAAWIAGLARRPATVETPRREVGAAIDAAAAAALEEEVELPCGARLWIEPTRALVAIDVDRAGSDATPAAVNAAAGREIARQLRLRRLGGIVAIDFLKEGLADGLSALRAFAEDDPWPMAPTRAPDASGLVSFQRARLGASLSDLATGHAARIYAALRQIVRLAEGGGERPRGLRASPAAIRHLQEGLAAALKAAEQRVGGPLDLERAEALRSIQIIGSQGRILDEA